MTALSCGWNSPDQCSIPKWTEELITKVLNLIELSHTLIVRGAARHFIDGFMDLLQIPFSDPLSPYHMQDIQILKELHPYFMKSKEDNEKVSSLIKLMKIRSGLNTVKKDNMKGKDHFDGIHKMISAILNNNSAIEPLKLLTVAAGILKNLSAGSRYNSMHSSVLQFWKQLLNISSTLDMNCSVEEASTHLHDFVNQSMLAIVLHDIQGLQLIQQMVTLIDYIAVYNSPTLQQSYIALISNIYLQRISDINGNHRKAQRLHNLLFKAHPNHISNLFQKQLNWDFLNQQVNLIKIHMEASGKTSVNLLWSLLEIFAVENAANLLNHQPLPSLEDIMREVQHLKESF